MLCFNMSTIDQYASDRSCSAASRLNYRSYSPKNTLKVNLHPSIPTPKNTTGLQTSRHKPLSGSLYWLRKYAQQAEWTVSDIHHPFSGSPKATPPTEYQYESLEHIRGPPRRPCREIRRCLNNRQTDHHDVMGQSRSAPLAGISRPV